MRRVVVAIRTSGVVGQRKLDGVFDYLGEDKDWDIHLVRSDMFFTRDFVREAIDRGTDGFLVSATRRDGLQELFVRNAPAVVFDFDALDPAFRTRPNTAVFTQSADAVAAAAFKCLTRRNDVRTMAFVHNPNLLPWSVARAAALRRLARAAGIPFLEIGPDDDLVLSLARAAKPLAVLAANDDRALATLFACRQVRLAVPDEIRVVGVDNDESVCERTVPRLTSVDAQARQAGFRAAEVLDRLMAGEAVAHVVRCDDCRLVPRESAHEDTTGLSLVQSAKQFISDHVTEGIGVPDVVAHLKVSRSLADLRFRQLTGATLGEEIREKRLDATALLLRQTDRPITAICTDCGWSDLRSAKNIFKRRYAMSMRDWRTKGGNKKSN